MKFLIKKNHKKEKFIKDQAVYGTGIEYHSIYEDMLYTTRISKDKIKYRTGLNEHDLKTSPVLLEDLRAVYLKNLDNARQRILEVYGEDALDNTNEHFWNSKGVIKVTTDTLNTVFDDETDLDALILKFNIAAGGYSDIAPSLECALASGKNFYVVEQEEYNTENFEESVNLKLKANSALNNLYDKGSADGLLYLSWVVLNETQGFTRNTSKEVIVNALSEYIDGKLVNKDKKSCAKNFLHYAKMWKDDKEALITEAIFNVSVYYGLIYLIEGKYTTKTRTTVLSGNKANSIKMLSDVKNIEELKELKEDVDKRLNK
jgi:hypothetical protein